MICMIHVKRQGFQVTKQFISLKTNILLDAFILGTSIERLYVMENMQSSVNRGAMIRAAKLLLSSITRVLLLADIVVVKQLLLAKDKVYNLL